MKALLKLLRRLPQSCRLLVWLGLVLSVLSALMEVLMLAAAVPFLSQLSGKATSLSASQLPHAGVQFAMFLVLATVLRLFSLWLSSYSAAQVGHELATGVLLRFLCMPYAQLLSQRSSQISATAIQHCSTAALALRNLLQLMQATLVSAALVVALAVLQPFVAGSVVLGLGLVYGLLLRGNRRFFDLWGDENTQAANDQLKAVQETLGAIRDIQLDHAQASSVLRFSDADYRSRLSNSRIEVWASAPRFVLEAILLLLIIFLSVILVLANPKGSADLIAILGAFALGGQRLIPSLQQCYASVAVLRSSQSALKAVSEVFDLSPAPEFAAFPAQPNSTQSLPADPQSLDRQTLGLRLDRISYHYPGSKRRVLEDFSLRLHPGECLGIIGPTGSGKSTLLDILMGLLIPQSGTLWLNDACLNPSSADACSRLRRWRSNLAHVPQQVFIADTTLLENIAFGVERAAIDHERVRQVARAAQLDGLIGSLPQGYQTIVGERGAFLSGGQRQRLGLARALYKGASLLILDEATSALDGETEAAVLVAIDAIRQQRQITVVMVAHRLSTLLGCDRILALREAPLPAKEFRRPFPPDLLG
jgi:ABC-type multidrug transport system fused ATPase/permease subunit